MTVCPQASTPSSAQHGKTASRCRTASGRRCRWLAGSCGPDPLVQVLDEPTSALDAETEHALFERYADAAGTSTNGGITLLVSHRFSTVRMADIIVVLDGSTVVEVGSHEELMVADGQYAELYDIQATSYQ